MKAFVRKKAPGSPAGLTVTKRDKLPDGDFLITGYLWGECALWFVHDDYFTAAEREEARWKFLGTTDGHDIEVPK